MSRPRAKPTPQAGQAMVEAAIMLGTVVLLFLAIWYLGKFHDLQASTIQASRYAAWERTVRPPAFSDVQLEKQTRARLFMWNQNPYKDSDGKANGQTWDAQSAMWEDHAGAQRLLDRPSDVSVSTTYAKLPGKAAATTSALIGMVTRGAGKITGGEELPPGGLYTSRVSVRLSDIASLPAPLNALNLTLNETSALVVDSWDASSPSHAAKRTRTYTPTGALRNIDSMLAPLKWALSIIEPSFDNLHPGRICPDIVPADRVTGSNLPAYGGAQCY